MSLEDKKGNEMTLHYLNYKSADFLATRANETIKNKEDTQCIRNTIETYLLNIHPWIAYYIGNILWHVTGSNKLALEFLDYEFSGWCDG